MYTLLLQERGPAHHHGKYTLTLYAWHCAPFPFPLLIPNKLKYIQNGKERTCLT